MEAVKNYYSWRKHAIFKKTRYLLQIYGPRILKLKGCLVTDLDNKKYYDLSTMSVGTNSLGYSNSKVDSAVKKVINNGNISTLNCPEEVYLAKTCKITYWAKK